MSSSLSKQRAGPVNLQPFLAGDLGDGAVGAEVAAHDADVAGALDRLLERVDDLLARRRGPGSSTRFSAIVLPVTVMQSPSSSPFPAGTSSRPACRRRGAGLPCTYLPLGLRSARNGTRSLTFWKSSIVSGTSTARAMAIRCSTALVEPPRAMTIDHRVLERGAGHDVARLEVLLEQIAGSPCRPRCIRRA